MEPELIAGAIAVPAGVCPAMDDIFSRKDQDPLSTPEVFVILFSETNVMAHFFEFFDGQLCYSGFQRNRANFAADRIGKKSGCLDRFIEGHVELDHVEDDLG